MGASVALPRHASLAGVGVSHGAGGATLAGELRRACDAVVTGRCTDAAFAEAAVRARAHWLAEHETAGDRAFDLATRAGCWGIPLEAGLPGAALLDDPGALCEAVTAAAAGAATAVAEPSPGPV